MVSGQYLDAWGQDTLDYIETGKIAQETSKTSHDLLIDGEKNNLAYPLSVYGSLAKDVKVIQNETNNFDKLHSDLPYFQAEVIYQARFEKAKTVEDVLARRTRAAFLNIKASIESSVKVAEILAAELDRDQAWQTEQVNEFKLFSENFNVEKII